MHTFAGMMLETMHYEQWLRFHFLEDVLRPDAERTAAIIRVPEAEYVRSCREQPQFAELLQEFQGQEVSLARSRDLIFRHVCERSGIPLGSAAFADAMAALVADASFRRSVDLFQSWTQELADGEAAQKGAAQEGRSIEAPSFGEWEAAFRNWVERQQDSAANALGKAQAGVPADF